MDKSYYFIVPTVDITLRMINLSNSNGSSDFRINNDGTKCIIEVIPPLDDTFLDNYLIFNHIEILEELKNEEWLDG